MKISRNAKSPKRGQPRRRVVPLWRSRKVRGTLIALLVVLAAGGGWRMWQSGWVPGAIDKAKWKMIALASDLGFKVDEILVIGRRETAQKDLLAAVRLSRACTAAGKTTRTRVPTPARVSSWAITPPRAPQPMRRQRDSCRRACPVAPRGAKRSCRSNLRSG